MQQDGQFHDQLFPGSVLTNRHSPCWPTHFPRTLAVGSPSGDTPAPTPAMTTMTPNAVSEPPAAFSTTAGPTSLSSALFTPATTLSPTSSQFLTFLPTSAPATAALSECDVYGGNGYCDLDLNNPDCELDKGDCCPCEFRTKIVIVILIFIRPKPFDSLFYDGQPNKLMGGLRPALPQQRDLPFSPDPLNNVEDSVCLQPLLFALDVLNHHLIEHAN